jgi:hypothetical protein
MCNPSCDEEVTCKEPAKSRSIQFHVGASMPRIGPITLPMPSIHLECVADCKQPSVTAACKPACEPAQYCIQTKIVRQKGDAPEVTCCPRVTVDEKQRARVCLNHPVGCGLTNGEIACDLEVCVCESTDCSAKIETSCLVNGTRIKHAGDAYTTRGMVTKSTANVAFGKPFRIPLSGCYEAEAWLELEVNKVCDEECEAKCSDPERTRAACVVDCKAPCAATVCAPPTRATSAVMVPPPAHTLTYPQMAYLRVIRQGNGNVVVEPPAPCPMPVSRAVPAQRVTGCAIGHCVPAASVVPQPATVAHMPPVACAAVTSAAPMPVPAVAAYTAATRVVPAVVPSGVSTPPMERSGAIIRAASGKACLEVECGG